MTRFNKAALISQDSASVIGAIFTRSANKIIVVGIGKVTQFSIILIHRDKQSIQHTSTQEASEKEANEKGRIKWQR